MLILVLVLILILINISINIHININVNINTNTNTNININTIININNNININININTDINININININIIINIIIIITFITIITFFIIYVNDMQNVVTKGVQLRSFADSSKIYKFIVSIIDCICLQMVLSQVAIWLNLWQLTLKCDKSFVLHLGKANPHCTQSEAIHYQHLTVYVTSA